MSSMGAANASGARWSRPTSTDDKPCTILNLCEHDYSEKPSNSFIMFPLRWLVSATACLISSDSRRLLWSDAPFRQQPADVDEICIDLCADPPSCMEGELISTNCTGIWYDVWTMYGLCGSAYLETRIMCIWRAAEIKRTNTRPDRVYWHKNNQDFLIMNGSSLVEQYVYLESIMWLLNGFRDCGRALCELFRFNVNMSDGLLTDLNSKPIIWSF